MKKHILFCLAALLCLGSGPAARAQAPQSPTQTPSNPYDTLGRVLTPIASVFTPEAPRRALSATLVLEQMTDLPPELTGSRVELLLQPPEHFLLRGSYNGVPVTLCRAGNAIWVTPNIPPFSLLANPPGAPASMKAKGGLEPMILPFPPQQLALLPLFFKIKEGTPEQGLRTLDVRLMPELARSLGVEEWSLRLSLNAAEQLMRLRVAGPGWSLAARVERLEFAASLPPATWKAPADALRLDAGKVDQWQRELSRQMEGNRPTR